MATSAQLKTKIALHLTDDELEEIEELGIQYPGQFRHVDPDDLSSGLREKAADYLPEQNGNGED